MAKRYKNYTAGPDDDQKRLDRIIRSMFPDVPLGAIARLIRTGDVRVNGGKADHNQRVQDGDRVEAPESFGTARNDRPPAQSQSRNGAARDRRPRRDSGDRPAGRERGPRREGGPSARNERGPRREGFDRDRPQRRDSGVRSQSSRRGDARDSRGTRPDPFPTIIFRDNDLLVLNKPAGMPVHGSRSLATLVVRRAQREGWTRESLSFRPGPVHRLDRETSGVQVFGLSINGARKMAEAFQGRSARKVYLAVVHGKIDRRIESQSPLSYDRATRKATAGDGKPARTMLVPLGYRPDQGYSLVAAIPLTGRTHQIRAHAALLGHPLVGDDNYGGNAWDVRPRPFPFHFLHNLFLSVKTDENAAPSAWQAPLAPDAWHFVKMLFGDSSPIESRIDSLLADVCTALPPGTTIKL